VEFVVAKIEGGVDRLEGLEVNVDLSLLPFASNDFTAVHDEAVRRDLGVELEALLSRSDSRQYGETVNTGFDVGSRSLLAFISLACACRT